MTNDADIMPRQPLKVLHLEDNASDAEQVQLTLCSGGFQCDVHRVDARESFLKALQEAGIDIILSDYSLPEFDGLSALALAREKRPAVPFIFVTAAIEEDLAIEALRSGSCDFVRKQRLARLVPAVRRALHETEEHQRVQRGERAAHESVRRMSILALASAELSEWLDYKASLAAVARLLVKDVAEWCAVYLTEDATQARVLTVAHSKTECAEWLKAKLWAYDGDFLAFNGHPHPIENCIPMALFDLDSAGLERLARTPQQLEILKSLELTSCICVPLCGNDAALGAIMMGGSRPPRQLTQADFELVCDLAHRAANTVQTARLYRRAQAAIHARDEFLSIASHELKTPLTTLQLEIQLLRHMIRKCQDHKDPAPLEPGKILNNLEIVERQIKKLSRLINDLMDVTRIDAGKLEIRLAEFDLSRLVVEVADRFSRQLSLANCPLNVRADKPVIGNWDRMRLDQVVTNLLSNAMKYGHGKPIQVIVEESHAMARLIVRDQGIGIPADSVSRIFGRFERATSSRNFGGLGLGLFIVKQIVDALGGRVQVLSAPGAGSTFTVELPISVEEPAGAHV